MARISSRYPGQRSWAPWQPGGAGWDDLNWHQELPINVYDSADTWIVTAPVPGMEEGDVQVECEGDAIIIRAEPKGYPQFPKDYLMHEWHVGPYHRRVMLPSVVEARTCDASVAAGMLVIRIRKPEWERVVHIPVTAAGAEQGVIEGQARSKS